MLRPLALLVLIASPARAETIRFDLVLRGVTGGQVALAADVAGGRYAVTGRAQGTGVVGTLVRYSYEGSATGELVAGAPRSERYVEVETGRRGRFETTTTFTGGRVVSAVVAPTPERDPWDIDPVGQRGIDPLSALWDLTRTVPADGVCTRGWNLFDGQRLSRLKLSGWRVVDGRSICDATYTRIAGYSPDELSRRDGTRFTITYAPVGDGMVRAIEMRADTRLGPAVMRLR
ncbi:DUF3108 domain-containing protein [uncultured Jannaschia sp.]|uniref:DUF3108 domain-containing protein n=1 Tax=uncultured Jannaschia sp. TaxID=293347 RepID=UPI00260DA2D5|nr:DUF3108 domain-containing protein [uncultured Jannaschia sp.]